MSEGITLQPEGLESLNKAMVRLIDPARRTDLMAQIGVRGVAQTQQNFLNQSAPDGAIWPVSLRVRRQSGQPLRHTNRLFTSLTFNATSEQVEWGTNVIYAGIHHFGGVIKPKTKKSLTFKGANGKWTNAKAVTIPPRPFLGLSESNKTDIAEIVDAWTRKAWA